MRDSGLEIRDSRCGMREYGLELWDSRYGIRDWRLEDQGSGIRDSMRDAPVVVFRTQSSIEADVVRGLLETHGIVAMISSDLSRTAFPLSTNEVRVAVSAEDA